ncbi:MOSC domain-containing protein [Roseibium sp.]|uniref:MOSC domain-containing protein n=1 Tax=Roseibium sp. TaxID=1936156 RepID=UPI003262D060
MSSAVSPDAMIQQLSVTPARKLTGQVTDVLKTLSPGDFATQSCDALDLEFSGISGDRHGGFTRKSGGREPWYPRGTEMCNERQVSILSPAELALVAERMELETVEAAWIGGNIVLDGFPNLSLIPPRTRLVFENGTVIRVDGDNAPCRASGKSIAAHVPGREGLDLLFPKVAKRLRGLVGYVEKPGTISAGESVTAVIPEQWIYNPA